MARGNSEPRIVTVRSGPFRLRAVACLAGSDLTVTVTGGDRPHVGCVVLAQASPARDDRSRIRVTSSVVTIPHHREEALARPLAERLAKALRANVVVSAGVHTDRLSPEGIGAYLELGQRLAERLIQRFSR